LDIRTILKYKPRELCFVPKPIVLDSVRYLQQPTFGQESVPQRWAMSLQSIGQLLQRLQF
jgi:hypothetical protein